MRVIGNTDDVIDIRDVIENFEELEEAKEAFEEQIEEWREELEDEESEEEKQKIMKKIEEWGEWHETDEGKEYIILEGLLDDLKGYGGDEQWRGDWYPVTLIHTDHFTDYCKELVKDCGYISDGFPWWIEVDWEKTADNMAHDYSLVDYDGEDYYYR